MRAEDGVLFVIFLRAAPAVVVVVSTDSCSSSETRRRFYRRRRRGDSLRLRRVVDHELRDDGALRNNNCKRLAVRRDLVP